MGSDALVNIMTNDINQLQLAVAMLIRLVVRAPFSAWKSSCFYDN